jgi:outer membrane protein TolC
MRVIGPGMLVASVAAHAGADQATARGLGLAEVVKATLSSSPELALAAEQVRVLEGALLVSRADFDLKLLTSATASRVHTPDGKGAHHVEKSLGYSASAQRLLRSGVLISPAATLAHVARPGSIGVDTNSVDAGLGVSIPLLRNRGGATSAAAERATERDYQSSRWQRRHVAAERVLSAVAAYWDYQAARRRLEVLQSSEELAKRTVEETRALVEADERTPADLIQVRGNVASKRVARTSAEQRVIEARTELGLAMGLPAPAIAGLAPPATDFPELGDGAPRIEVARLVEDAYRRRADLAAADEETRSARIRIEAARSELRPRLDLGLSTGYTATAEHEGFGRFFSSLHRDAPRLDAFVDLTFEFPVGNSAARGRMLQSTSAYEQSRIAYRDLRRRIAAGVAVALEAVAHASAGMRGSEEAVLLFESGVKAVQRKFQLGASTLFDLIQAQDALTNAQLSHVQSQRDYAVAIAALRFQSGRLVEGDRDALVVPVAGLLRPP